MKFGISQVVALIAAASSTVALPTVTDSPSFNDMNKQCDDALATYNECFTVFFNNPQGVDGICVAFESQKCQNFYNTGYNAGVEACKNDSRGSTFNAKNDDFLYNVMKLSCVKDENGKLCPFGEIATDLYIHKNKITDDQYEKLSANAIKATCYSKACTDSVISYYEHEKKNATPDERLQSVMKGDDDYNFLKSKECTDQHSQISNSNGNDNNNASILSNTSDASTLSYTSALVVGTALVLSTLL